MSQTKDWLAGIALVAHSKAGAHTVDVLFIQVLQLPCPPLNGFGRAGVATTGRCRCGYVYM